MGSSNNFQLLREYDKQPLFGRGAAKKHERLRECGSLPADVLWGSFVMNA